MLLDPPRVQAGDRSGDPAPVGHQTALGQQQPQQQQQPPAAAIEPPPPRPQTRQRTGGSSRAPSPTPSAGTKRRKGEVQLLPDGRVAVLAEPMPAPAAIHDACMKATVPHTHKYPFITPDVLEEVERTALTTRQASHVSWACQFAKLRYQATKHGWKKWESHSCPAAWELVADAQAAWPRSDTSQYSDREAASRSWGRWTWARNAFVRPERPRDPVADLKDRAMEGQHKAARALARAPGAPATDEEATDSGRQPKEARGEAQRGHRGHRGPDRGHDGPGGSGTVRPDSRTAQHLEEQRRECLERAAELQAAIEAEQRLATRAARHAEMAEQADPGAGAHNVRRDTQVGRYVTHGGSSTLSKLLDAIVCRDSASPNAPPLPCSREGWESPETDRTRSDADLAQALLDDMAQWEGEEGDGDGQRGSPTGRAGGAAGRAEPESSPDPGRSRVPDSAQ